MTRSLHVCYVIHEYPMVGFPHGGIGSFVKTIATELVKRGHRVSVVGLNYTRVDLEEVEQGVHLYRIGRTGRRFSWFRNASRISQTIAKIHREHPVDIVETAELGLAFIQKLPEVKYVIRLHGGHHFFAESEHRNVNPWKGFQERRSFARCDAFVAVSDYVREHTAKFLSYHGKTVELIRYPIDTERFRPKPVPVIKGRLVFAGTVCEKKGVRQLIQAFRIVHDEFPDATLEIYGRDWKFRDGSSYIEMLRHTELPKLGPAAARVTLHGPVDYSAIPDCYAPAHVCVFPSHMETQGLVAPEAMSMGKTVVFTTYGPGPETITPGETGLLCDPYDPQDIAAQILYALMHDTTKMAEDGRAFVQRQYGLQPIVERNLNFYSRMAK